MRRAILIGFQYEDSQYLPGIVTDLFQIYTFLKEQGWSDGEIKVLTDVHRDETAQRIRRAVVEKLVDATILSFIEDLKSKDQYVQFYSHNHYNNLSTVFPAGDHQLFVYYTGHAKAQHIILPGNVQFSFAHFQLLFGEQTTFCIMDCCHGGLELAFNLIQGVYRSHHNLPLTKTKIMCLASTKSSQLALTGETGSPFTKQIISALTDEIVKKTRTISDLLAKLPKSYSQTATISASYPHLHHIFGFIYSNPTIEIIHYPKYISVTLL